MDAMFTIEAEESRITDEPQLIQVPIPLLVRERECDLPLFVAVLEADLPFNPIADLLEDYERPLPLHKLRVMELRRLEVSMRHLLEAFGDIRRSANLEDVPGWLTLIATEYGFVHAALQTIPFDESDALPPR